MKTKKFLALLLSLLLVLQMFTASFAVSAATNDVYDYSGLCSSIDASSNIRSDAKEYVKNAIKTYINTVPELKSCLNQSNGNTLLFFFEGASIHCQTTYSGSRNNAALLMVAMSGGKPKLLSCSPYFSTLPDDPLAVGCYRNYLDPEGKGDYGPGTLKDGVYPYAWATSNYKSSGCKAYLLSNTTSVYLTSGSYKTLTSTEIFIHGRKDAYPLIADKLKTSNTARSIGCLTGDMSGNNYYLSTFGDYMDPQNGIGYVIVNRVLFKNTLYNWLSNNGAVNEIVSYSDAKVPSTGSSTNPVNTASTLKISPTSTSYTITKGNSCSIGGTISSNYNLTSVIGTLDGKQYAKITSFSSPKSCSIGDYSANGLNSFAGSSLSVGTHTIKITAKDSSGKSATATITITVKAAATSTLKISPTSTSYTITKGNSCSIGGTISSNYNLTSVIGTLDGKQYAKITSFSSPKSCSIGDYSANGLNSFAGSSLSVGTHTIKITAKDSSGKSATATITITVKATAASTLAITPTKTSYTISKGCSCSIGGSITSNYNLTTVTGTLDGTQYAKITSFSSPKSCNIGDYSANGLNSFKASALKVGTHTIVIKATDKSGKSVTKKITIIVK